MNKFILPDFAPFSGDMIFSLQIGSGQAAMAAPISPTEPQIDEIIFPWAELILQALVLMMSLRLLYSSYCYGNCFIENSCLDKLWVKRKAYHIMGDGGG